LDVVGGEGVLRDKFAEATDTEFRKFNRFKKEFTRVA